MGKVKTEKRRPARKGSRGGNGNLLRRITVDPEILVGKPTIRGMRISVEHILNLLAKGMTHKEILHEFPILVEKDILAAIEYAHRMVSQEKVYRVTRIG